MVDEDGEQSKASEEIEPKVAFHSAAGHHRILRSNRVRRGPLDTIRGTRRGERRNARHRRRPLGRPRPRRARPEPTDTRGPLPPPRGRCAMLAPPTLAGSVPPEIDVLDFRLLMS